MANEKESLNPTREIQFDYDNQAWIINGIYQDCGHRISSDVITGQQWCATENSTRFLCYGRKHKGKRAPSIH
jgi:hypothetical protein